MKATRAIVTGFDWREDWLDPQRWFTPERRLRYLLKTDVIKPLSVDRWVWLSPFGPSLDQESFPVETRHQAFTVAERPAYVGRFDPFWESLTSLREFAAQHASEYGHGRIIAITSTNTEVVAEEHAQPGSPGSTWRLLGYDVVSDDGYSGLMNCGYDEEEKSALADTWAPLLNVRHLFHDDEDAARFVEITGARVPEHAPFQVLGLWEVERLPAAT